MSHAGLVFFMALHQLPRTVGLEATEHGDTFSFLHFLVSSGISSIPTILLMARSIRLHMPPSHRASIKKSVPAPALCQQEVFKLVAAFSFQFQQYPFPNSGIPKRRCTPCSNALDKNRNRSPSCIIKSSFNLRIVSTTNRTSVVGKRILT